MCRGKGLNLMVMDVEGTDGRERGEDQVRFSMGCFVLFFFLCAHKCG